MAGFFSQGYYWQSPVQSAYLAVGILTCIVLLACVFLSIRARWTCDKRKATRRRGVYVLSTVTVLLHVLIIVIDVGVNEGLRSGSLDRRYYIIYIFSSMLFQISEFSILAVMFWTVHIMLFGDFQSCKSSRVIRILSIVGFTIVGVLSVISWVLFTAILGSFINNTSFSYTLVNAQNGIEVAYMAAFTTCSISLSTVAAFAVARERTMASLLIFFAALLLALRAVFILTDSTVSAYSHSYDYEVIFNLHWATSFIYFLATVGLYLCVGTVGNMSPNGSSKVGTVASEGCYTYKPHNIQQQREV